jgi:hypothetical protein
LSICGFGLATGPLCYKKPANGDEGYCHGHEAIATCVSCGQRASHECPAFNALDTRRCAVPLCGNCEHKATFDVHGPIVPPAEQVRQGLVESMKIGLKDAQQQGLCDVPEETRTKLAGMLVDHLAQGVLIQLLSGMNMPR